MGDEMSEAVATGLSPQEIVRRLSALYGTPEWRPHGDPMTELVLTILSQNTSDANSGRAFMRLRARFPTWESLLAADPPAIEEAIRIGGLSQVKAVRIKALLAEVVRRRGSLDLSFLRALSPPEARAWLEGLPGVGPKTAACVLLFSLGLPALPVDTHVHRVALRLGLVPLRTPPARAQALLEEWVPPELHYQFHVLLIRHGRRLCRAQRPLCPRCPLLADCPYGRSLAA
jgi:endonuclease-3